MDENEKLDTEGRVEKRLDVALDEIHHDESGPDDEPRESPYTLDDATEPETEVDATKRSRSD